eukprot:s2405_g4.t1
MDAWMMDVDAWIGGYGWIWMGLDVDGDGRTDAGIQARQRRKGEAPLPNSFGQPPPHGMKTSMSQLELVREHDLCPVGLQLLRSARLRAEHCNSLPAVVCISAGLTSSAHPAACRTS